MEKTKAQALIGGTCTCLCRGEGPIASFIYLSRNAWATMWQSARQSPLHKTEVGNIGYEY